jgi:ribosome-associated protein
MRTALEGRRQGAPTPELAPEGADSKTLLANILHWLDEAKAEKVVTIGLEGKSSIGDYMVIASGRTDRHVGAIGEQIQRKLKELGYGRVRIQGLEASDWVLIDTGDVIVHIFRPEVREFYNLERMWSAERPADTQTH